MAEWFENETFWETMYPYMFSETRVGMAAEEVARVIQLTGMTGGAVLDLCCGPGRHAVMFAKRGYQVTGVDRTPYLLSRAVEKARPEGVTVEWIEEDMRSFQRPQTYDLAVNMLTSLGYFDDPREDVQVLTNLYQSLKPGGACVFDMMGREVLARNFQPTVSEKYPDGSILIQRLEIREEWGRLSNERILVTGEKALTYRFQQRIYSGQELKTHLQQVGFTNVKLYGSLTGAEYGPTATRLVAVGWKPAASS